jgi:hypothetical protein
MGIQAPKRASAPKRRGACMSALLVRDRRRQCGARGPVLLRSTHSRAGTPSAGGRRKQRGPVGIDAMPDGTLGVRRRNDWILDCRPGAHPLLTGSVSDDGCAASWWTVCLAVRSFASWAKRCPVFGLRSYIGKLLLEISRRIR